MANNTGKKFGGRKKGTPNKLTIDITNKLNDHGCDPIEGLVQLALNTDSEEMKFKVFRELAQYVAPKRRAVDVVISDSKTHEEKLKELR